MSGGSELAFQAAGLLLGAIVGSFLATLLIRWPQGRSVATGRSRCDSCGAKLGVRDLVIASGACTDSAINRITFEGLDYAAVPDFDLMRRASRGDSQAFEVLYDELSPAVYGLARRVVRDPARAEDVTQEVFLDVWRKATRFDADRGKAKTWIMTIAHRRAESDRLDAAADSLHAPPDEQGVRIR